MHREAEKLYLSAVERTREVSSAAHSASRAALSALRREPVSIRSLKLAEDMCERVEALVEALTAPDNAAHIRASMLAAVQAVDALLPELGGIPDHPAAQAAESLSQLRSTLVDLETCIELISGGLD